MHNAVMIIQLEARLQPNIRFTFERALTVFTRSDKTMSKVNRFRRNLEQPALSTMSAAGPGRFCARCAQYGELERQAYYLVR